MQHWTEQELVMIDVVQKGLEQHVGKDNAVKTKYIVERMKFKGFPITPPKLREIIHYLRVHRRMFIVGDDAGYYVADNYDERVRQIASMKSRIKEMQEVYEALLINHNNKLNQQKLFA